MAANGGACLRSSGEGPLCAHRVRRWCRKGVLDEILQALHDMGVIGVSMEVVSLDSTIVKVHLDGTAAVKASEPLERRGIPGRVDREDPHDRH